MSRIDAKLDAWFLNLPQVIKDGPSVNNTYLFIFIIHMQFHFIKVQLRQPFAFHTDTTGTILQQISRDCRKLCASSAIEIARLFATFRLKHDIRYLQSRGTQYAMTAARFLIKHISSLPPDELVEPEAHVRSLAKTLEDMSRTFKPALKSLREAMDDALAVITEHVQPSLQPGPDGQTGNLSGLGSVQIASLHDNLDLFDTTTDALNESLHPVIAGTVNSNELNPFDAHEIPLGAPTGDVWEDLFIRPY